ncbi:MAG: polyphosphate kinase 1 [Treponema sp.]|jgi:polyphosphate kinase|nr:polyphosphate kinase 1 [Treponema sp.]
MPQIYFNREISWLDFNARVLEEALRPDLPPLERYKYLTIVSSNFDEFFMVRVAAIKRAMRNKNNAMTEIENASHASLYQEAQRKARDIIKKQYDCLLNDVIPALSKNGLHLLFINEWDESQKEIIEHHFIDKVFPLLTPLRLDVDIPAPGGNMYAAFSLQKETNCAETKIAIVKIPSVRIVMLPSNGDGSACFFLIEDSVLCFASRLFPGYSIKERMLFKIDRDADFSVDEERDEDFIKAMEEVVVKRERSRIMRMVHSEGSSFLRDEVARHLKVDPRDIYQVPGPLDLANLAALYDIEDFGISGFENLKSNYHAEFLDIFFDNNEKSLWERIKTNDILLHFPYESFDPVLMFFSEAARDPSVMAIKVTLYRTSGDSPIAQSLKEAALNGKQVTAIVELKARFDEERNINWAKDLEMAGVTVIYGLARLKVHAKAALVIRKEDDGLSSYLHLSTGNYNDKTAKTYADLCLFTAGKDFIRDAELFFNMITGYSNIKKTKHLIIAPLSLKKRIIELIDRETEKASGGQNALIKAKMNALADTDVIDALYRASNAGVKIYLNVRGICMLVPGLAGLSENIKVVSIIDYFLEHSRIIFFENGGDTELYLSSADWMTRNLERRVELMFPVIDKEIKYRVSAVLDLFFKDNSHAHTLGTDGAWRRMRPALGEECFQVQKYLKEYTHKLYSECAKTNSIFIVRR